VLGIWDYGATTEGMYQLCLIVFVLCAVAIIGIRKSRTGRVLVALRENERGARAYGVSAVGAKLTAFAISGFFASIAGVVLVQVNGQFTLGLFPPEENLITFTAAVVGGLGSVLGAVLGAIFLKGGQWFLNADWRLLASGIGVLLVLLLLPGGLSGAFYRVRDLGLRSLARRRGIVVPSLLADIATDPTVDAPVPDMTEPAPASQEEVPTPVSTGGGAA
jgi:branched-chain amino acid transport system permease protein